MEQKIKLKLEEKKELRKIQQSTKNKRIYRKIAVILGIDLGISYPTLAEMLSLDEVTIRRYELDYLSQKLADYLKDDYVAYWGKLDSFQLAELVKELRTNLYTNTQEIAEFIDKKFGVNYNSQGLVHLLHRIGFVYKKPKEIPSKANGEEQEKFLTYLNEIHSGLKDNEVLYFGDAVHPQHNTEAAYGWIEKGKEKEIKANTGRTRVNLNGALDPDKLEVVAKEYDTINAESIIDFYQELENKNIDKDKIYMIIDNAKYYKNYQVEKYLETSKIKQIYLPPYSPNLNLIERLWKFMRKKVINNKYYAKSNEFRKTLLEFFSKIYTYKDELKKLLRST